jgi:hypothetical protein
MGLFARIAVFLIVLALTGAPASAQSPFGDFGLGQGAQRAEPEPDRPPDLEAYGSIAESYRASSALENTERQVARLRDRIAETLARAPHIAEDVRATLAAAAPSGEATYFLGLLVFLGFLLGIGRAVSILFAVYVARPIFVGMQKPNPQGLAEKLPVLATRVGMQAVIIAITVLVAVLVGSGFYPEDERASVVTAILFFGAFGVWRMADTMFRMLLAPFLPAYRLLAMSDRAAIRLYRWLSALLLYRILSHGAVIWLDQLGLSATTSAFLHLVAAAVEIVIVLVGGWVNRAADQQRDSRRAAEARGDVAPAGGRGDLGTGVDSRHALRLARPRAGAGAGDGGGAAAAGLDGDHGLRGGHGDLRARRLRDRAVGAACGGARGRANRFADKGPGARNRRRPARPAARSAR